MKHTLAFALVALAALALARAQGSTMGAGSAAVGAHGEHVVDILEHEIARGRQLMDYSDGGRAPAWHGRFDPNYKLSYFSPALTSNSCDPASQNCAAIPGMPNLTYPYSYIVADPNNATSTQPVMQIFYPPGAWASSQEVPSGTLIYSYPFKSNPNDLGGSISAAGASLEYQVYFPTGFDFVKGAPPSAGPPSAPFCRACGVPTTFLPARQQRFAAAAAAWCWHRSRRLACWLRPAVPSSAHHLPCTVPEMAVHSNVSAPPPYGAGGKLPGMAGGTKNGRGCGGGADPAWCFSFRIMWRRNGQGEAYL
jgi:hypothetical protein